MEKWNSKRAKELGVDGDLLAAVNVAVKAGRAAMAQLMMDTESQLYLLRRALTQLHQEGVKLYEITMYDHYEAFGIDLSAVSFVPLQLSNPGEGYLDELNQRFQGNMPFVDIRHFLQGVGHTYLLAYSAQEIFEAAAKSMEHNYEREFINGCTWLENTGMVLDKDEDLRNPHHQEEFIIRTRLHCQEHVKELQNPPHPHMHALNNWIPGLHEKWQRISGEVRNLTREYCEPESEKWMLATKRMFDKQIEMRDGSSWSPSTGENVLADKADMAWEFLASLYPHLKDDGTAKRVLRSLMSSAST